MTNWQRRYEILLPLRFNDGNAVPDDLIAETLLELEQRFRARSAEGQAPGQLAWLGSARGYLAFSRFFSSQSTPSRMSS
jgi:hypothetical protein